MQLSSSVVQDIVTLQATEIVRLRAELHEVQFENRRLLEEECNKQKAIVEKIFTQQLRDLVSQTHSLTQKNSNYSRKIQDAESDKEDFPEQLAALQGEPQVAEAERILIPDELSTTRCKQDSAEGQAEMTGYEALRQQLDAEKAKLIEVSHELQFQREDNNLLRSQLCETEQERDLLRNQVAKLMQQHEDDVGMLQGSANSDNLKSSDTSHYAYEGTNALMSQLSDIFTEINKRRFDCKSLDEELGDLDIRNGSRQSWNDKLSVSVVRARIADCRRKKEDEITDLEKESASIISQLATKLISSDSPVTCADSQPEQQAIPADEQCEQQDTYPSDPCIIARPAQFVKFVHQSIPHLSLWKVLKDAVLWSDYPNDGFVFKASHHFANDSWQPLKCKKLRRLASKDRVEILLRGNGQYVYVGSYKISEPTVWSAEEFKRLPLQEAICEASGDTIQRSKQAYSSGAVTGFKIALRRVGSNTQLEHRWISGC